MTLRPLMLIAALALAASAALGSANFPSRGDPHHLLLDRSHPTIPVAMRALVPDRPDATALRLQTFQSCDSCHEFMFGFETKDSTELTDAAFKRRSPAVRRSPRAPTALARHLPAKSSVAVAPTPTAEDEPSFNPDRCRIWSVPTAPARASSSDTALLLNCAFYYLPRNFHEAERYARLANVFASGDKNAHAALGQIYAFEHDLERAHDELKLAIAIDAASHDPTLSDEAKMLAWLLNIEGDDFKNAGNRSEARLHYAEAYQYIRYAVALTPGDPDNQDFANGILDKVLRENRAQKTSAQARPPRARRHHPLVFFPTCNPRARNREIQGAARPHAPRTLHTPNGYLLKDVRLYNPFNSGAIKPSAIATENREFWWRVANKLCDPANRLTKEPPRLRCAQSKDRPPVNSATGATPPISNRRANQRLSTKVARASPVRPRQTGAKEPKTRHGFTP